MRKLSVTRTGIIIVFLALLAGTAMYARDASFFYENSATGPLRSVFPTLTGGPGSFSTPEPVLGMKMLTLPVKLTHQAHYAISFTVQEVIADAPVSLTVDLVGEGYDWNDQEFGIKLKPGTRNQIVRKTLYSGRAAPAEAALRIFFADPAQVTISDVGITGERRRVKRDFKRGLAAGALLLLGLILYYRRQLPRRPPLSGEQRVQVAVSVLFLLLVVAPLVQKELRIIEHKPLQENRVKLEKPKGNLLFKIYTEGIDYSKAYEKYFNDHYGLRDIFIQLKNQLDYNLFKRADSVIVGRDGWMEYKDVAAVQEIRSERMTPEDWQVVQAHTEGFQAYLQNQGIGLLWLPIHMKFSIYPEYQPRGVISRPARTAMDRLAEQFDANPDFAYTDARRLLLTGKREYPVFYKTDFHWNEIGAFIVAREVVNHLGRLSGRDVQWTHPLEFEKKPGFDGGINRYLALFFPPLEDKIELKQTWENRGAYLVPEPPFSLHYRARIRKGETLLPKTLVIGDSYTHYYFENNGFYEYFEEVYLLHSDHLRDLPRYLPEGVRYVVFQFIEVAVGGSFCNAEYWPEAIRSGPPVKTKQVKDTLRGRK